jgi:hypothetical protein
MVLLTLRAVLNSLASPFLKGAILCVCLSPFMVVEATPLLGCFNILKQFNQASTLETQTRKAIDENIRAPRAIAFLASSGVSNVGYMFTLLFRDPSYHFATSFGRFANEHFFNFGISLALATYSNVYSWRKFPFFPEWARQYLADRYTTRFYRTQAFFYIMAINAGGELLPFNGGGFDPMDFLVGTTTGAIVLGGDYVFERFNRWRTNSDRDMNAFKSSQPGLSDARFPD